MSEKLMAGFAGFFNKTGPGGGFFYPKPNKNSLTP